MGQEYPLEPVEVQKVNTANRCIQTAFPVPESINIIERMRKLEPRSMSGQPPVIWDRAEGFHVRDPYGNKWLDFSSGVLVTACGHGHPKITKAIKDMADSGVYHAYAFPTEIRTKLVNKLASLAPDPMNRVFLLTTGAEATECCIKLARTYGLRNFGKEKNIIVTFENSFHGRTMGSQLAGGMPALKEWIGETDPRFVQVPFPDGFRCKDVSFNGFEKALQQKGVDPKNVCGVMTETYQGVNVSMWPVEYSKAMRKWCDENNALLIFDEVQAGFGRTGKWFAFEHLEVVPDLAAFGKGISGGMPLSAVIGREEIMNQYGPGEMTSTHSANPVCSAAALANVEIIEEEGLVENAAALEGVIMDALKGMKESSDGHVGHIEAYGLAGAIQFTKPGTTEPDAELTWQVFKKCVEAGVLLFAPVGVGGCCIKITPPLNITREALEEGLKVVSEIVAPACSTEPQLVS